MKRRYARGKGRKLISRGTRRVVVNHLHDGVPPLLVHDIDPEGIVALV